MERARCTWFYLRTVYVNDIYASLGGKSSMYKSYQLLDQILEIVLRLLLKAIYCSGMRELIQNVGAINLNNL